MDKPPRIVAELGRPETPAETAARRAENTRKHRANQTVRNLVLALAASLGIVALLVLVVVRPTQPPLARVDWATVAAQYQSQIPEPLIAPVLPPGWTANRATLQTVAPGEANWRIGFITPTEQYVELVQGIGSANGWFVDQLGRAKPTATTTIDGTIWQVYDRRESADPGNFAYSLGTTVEKTRFLLHGTAGVTEVATLAAALVAGLAAPASAPPAPAVPSSPPAQPNPSATITSE